MATEQPVLVDVVQFLEASPGIGTEDDDLRPPDAIDAMDEESWRIWVVATAARGVASTLSMPLFDHGVVIGSVSLYTGTSHAFDDHHDEVAGVLGAWAGGAVGR